MARQGADRPRAPERRQPPNPQTDRTGPLQYLGEVRAEMKKVAWPPRPEIIQSTLVVIIGLIFMTTLIFGYDWLSVHFVEFVFG
jgi:preprotein translocase subunit SecE